MVLRNQLVLYATLIIDPVSSWLLYPCSINSLLRTLYSFPQPFRKLVGRPSHPYFTTAQFMTQDSVSDESSFASNHLHLKKSVLSSFNGHTSDATCWAEQFGLEDDSVAIFYALFSAIRSEATLGLRGKPIYLTEEDIRSTCSHFLHANNQLSGFFNFDDLTQALDENFLDANRGIANSKREAWKVRLVLNICFFLSVNLLFLGRLFLTYNFISHHS